MKKINNLLIFIVLMLSIYACGNEAKKDSSQETKVESINGDKLTAYKQYLNQLDSNDMTNIPKAVTYFTTNFKDTNGETNDSAYSIFNEFHLKVNFRVEESILQKDNEKFFNVINDNANNEVKPIVEKIKQNGFSFGITEGYVYISPDYVFQRKYFYAALSPTMQIYFTQAEKEDQEGFASDGGLIVPVKKIAERIVFWEKFNAQYPAFRWKYMVNQTIKTYTNVLFNGMDNTPMFIDEKLNPEYNEAYLFLKNGNAQTDIGQKASRYLELLEKNKGQDSPEAKDFRNKTAPWE